MAYHNPQAQSTRNYFSKEKTHMERLKTSDIQIENSVLCNTQPH